MLIKTFEDFFPFGYTEAEILCPYGKDVVRRMKLEGDMVRINAMVGPEAVVPVSTKITYQPWVLDRGSLLFECALTAPHPAKICTEMDTIRYPDGHTECVEVF